LAIHDAFGVEVHLSGIAWAVWIGLIAIYYILMEGYLGQTLGKVILADSSARGDEFQCEVVRSSGTRSLRLSCSRCLT
jgi:hypothetical protein